MTLASASIADSPLASLAEAESFASVGVMAPLSGYGYQGAAQSFRGRVFRATGSRTSYRAREDEMLGTADQDPSERVWYECDMIDVLNGASITELQTAGPLIWSQELVSNGQQVHKARALVSGTPVNETVVLLFYMICSDGAIRVRRLKIRGRDL